MSERYTVDYMWGGLEDEFRARLEAFIKASGGAITLLSGYRDNDHQADLVEEAKIRHGSEWRRWAAPPGRSNHNRGMAADLQFNYNSDYWENWARQNAHVYGLEFPMDWEPWHVEPMGLRTGKLDAEPWPDAYTPFANKINPTEQTLEPMFALDQMLRGSVDDLLSGGTSNDLLTGGQDSVLDGPDTPAFDPTAEVPRETINSGELIATNPEDLPNA